MGKCSCSFRSLRNGFHNSSEFTYTTYANIVPTVFPWRVSSKSSPRVNKQNTSQQNHDKNNWWKHSHSDKIPRHPLITKWTYSVLLHGISSISQPQTLSLEERTAKLTSTIFFYHFHHFWKSIKAGNSTYFGIIKCLYRTTNPVGIYKKLSWNHK